MKVVNKQGQIKQSGGGGSGSITVEELDGSPSVTSVTKIIFDQSDGLTVAAGGAGEAIIGSTGTPAPDVDARIYGLLALMGF